jgi:hypothetical protein
MLVLAVEDHSGTFATLQVNSNSMGLKYGPTRVNVEQLAARTLAMPSTYWSTAMRPCISRRFTSTCWYKRSSETDSGRRRRRLSLFQVP